MKVSKFTIKNFQFYKIFIFLFQNKVLKNINIINDFEGGEYV